MKEISLRSFLSTDRQTAEWMAAARSSETRVRIRRWSKIETIALASMLIGIALLIFAPFASIAVAIWSSASDTGRGHLHWWIWGVAIGVAGIGAAVGAVATSRRQRACFADGRVAVGTVDEAIEYPGSGDDPTWFDLRISAALPDGTTLHRRLHVQGEDLGLRAGGPIRFRHNRLDADALDDIFFEGWPATVEATTAFNLPGGVDR